MAAVVVIGRDNPDRCIFNQRNRKWVFNKINIARVNVKRALVVLREKFHLVADDLLLWSKEARVCLGAAARAVAGATCFNAAEAGACVFRGASSAVVAGVCLRATQARAACCFGAAAAAQRAMFQFQCIE